MNFIFSKTEALAALNILKMFHIKQIDLLEWNYADSSKKIREKILFHEKSLVTYGLTFNKVKTTK